MGCAAEGSRDQPPAKKKGEEGFASHSLGEKRCGIENPCFLTTLAHWDFLINVAARNTKHPLSFPAYPAGDVQANTVVGNPWWSWSRGIFRADAGVATACRQGAARCGCKFIYASVVLGQAVHQDCCVGGTRSMHHLKK